MVFSHRVTSGTSRTGCCSSRVEKSDTIVLAAKTCSPSRSKNCWVYHPAIAPAARHRRDGRRVRSLRGGVRRARRRCHPRHRRGPLPRAYHLARHKVPRQVVFVDELPRNATGKILGRDLVQLDRRSRGMRVMRGFYYILDPVSARAMTLAEKGPVTGSVPPPFAPGSGTKRPSAISSSATSVPSHSEPAIARNSNDGRRRKRANGSASRRVVPCEAWVFPSSSWHGPDSVESSGRPVVVLVNGWTASGLMWPADLLARLGEEFPRHQDRQSRVGPPPHRAGAIHHRPARRRRCGRDACGGCRVSDHRGILDGWRHRPGARVPPPTSRGAARVVRHAAVGARWDPSAAVRPRHHDVVASSR